MTAEPRGAERGHLPLTVISEEEWCAMGEPFAFRDQCEANGLPFATSEGRKKAEEVLAREKDWSADPAPQPSEGGN